MTIRRLTNSCCPDCTISTMEKRKGKITERWGKRYKIGGKLVMESYSLVVVTPGGIDIHSAGL